MKISPIENESRFETESGKKMKKGTFPSNSKYGLGYSGDFQNEKRLS